MKNLLFLFVSLMLICCGANNSNPASEDFPKSEPDSMPAKAKPDTPLTAVPVMTLDADTVSAEENAVATKVGAIRAFKMAPDTFKIFKKVASKDVVFDDYSVETDSVVMCGVVSPSGKYYVPVRYNDVRQIGRNLFVGEINICIDDPKLDIPNSASLYQVVYNGKAVGGMSALSDIKPVYYRGKVAGFLKTLHIEEADEHYLFFIDVHGKGWDITKDIRGTSYPKFEYFKQTGSVLTLWGGAKRAKDLKAFFPEDRSLYKVDLSNGHVLENPFVPSD